MASQPMWIDKFEPLEVWRFGLRLENILVTLLFSLLFSLIVGLINSAGVMVLLNGMVLVYSTSLFFLGYLFTILEFTSRGYQSPPRLSATLLDSQKARFFQTVAIFSIGVAGFFAFKTSTDHLIWASLLLLLLPFSISILIIEGDFLAALNPLKWLNIIQEVRRGEGFFSYLSILGFTLIAGLLALGLHLGVLNILTMALFVTAIMTLFRSLGVMLHANADALGLDVIYSKQIELAQTKKAQLQQHNAFVLELYKLSEARRDKQAFALLEEKLIKEKYAHEAAYFDLIKQWARPTLAIKMGQDYIARLVANHQYHAAWQVLEFCYHANGEEYTLKNGDTQLNLAVRAESISHRKLMANLLQFFDKDFPQHPKIAEAMLLSATFTARDLEDFPAAKKTLQRLAIKFPDVKTNPDYVALVQLVNNEPG